MYSDKYISSKLEAYLDILIVGWDSRNDAPHDRTASIKLFYEHLDLTYKEHYMMHRITITRFHKKHPFVTLTTSNDMIRSVDNWPPIKISLYHKIKARWNKVSRKVKIMSKIGALVGIISLILKLVELTLIFP